MNNPQTPTLTARIRAGAVGGALRVLALSLLFNFPYALFRVQQQAYDTYTHIFFADHYQRAWWDVWEPRWYLGFSVTAYPPLTHQLIALLGWPLTALIKFFAYTPEPYPGAWQWAGQEAAYVLVLLTALAIFPLGVRALARVWVGPRAADLAGMCAVFLPALAQAAWAFGQLPTVAATGVVLFALARGAAFVRGGARQHLLQAVLLAGVAAALHHAVFLFVPFAAFAVVLAHRPTRADLLRAAVWASLSAAMVALVLWPFLWWSRGQSLQTAIDHASRHNFFTDPIARNVFFWPMYGPLLWLVPFMLWRGWCQRLGAWLAACALLVVLGLGGTTALPALLFGAGWEWLTYDRFSVWAATLMLPLAGVWLARWRHARRARWWLAALLGWAGVAGWSSVLVHAQPPALDLTPLVYFLNEPAQQPYRYLTLGFGDQFAKLAALTTNGAPDGNYHTARALPELQTSGLGALDTAVWNPRGVQALTPILAHPEKYGLRWVFVNHPAYATVLFETGWRFRFDVGVVQAWERADVLPLKVPRPPPSWGAGWWGSVPLSVLGLALWALVVPSVSVTRASLIALLCSVRRVGWVGTVILLALWWFQPLYTQPHPDIYFIYRSVLLFACDGLLALSLGVWAIERALAQAPLSFGPRGVAVGGGALIMACVLSTFTAQNAVVAWAFTTHLIMLAVFYLALINDGPSVKLLGWGLSAVLVGLALVALTQTLEQRTVPLGVPWPGADIPATRGVSVVQDAAGGRWLRAYGPLPHPNILGGALVVGLGAVWVSVRKQRALAALAALGWLALWLSFSRAAWVGAGVFVFILSVRAWFAPATRPPWRLFVGAAIGMFAIVAAALGSFMWARSTLGGAVPLEQRSINERLALLQIGMKLSAQHPLMGVGVGNFVLAMERVRLPRQPWEPVHNLYVLVLAETGGVGLAALLFLLGASAWRAWARRRVADSIEWGWLAVLIGVASIALFDHYWWTMPPMRLLGALVLGLWVSAGLNKNDPSLGRRVPPP